MASPASPVSMASTVVEAPLTFSVPVYPILLDPFGSFLRASVRKPGEMIDIQVLGIFTEKVSIGTTTNAPVPHVRPLSVVPIKTPLKAEELLLRLLIQIAKKTKEGTSPESGEALSNLTPSSITNMSVMAIELYKVDMVNERLRFRDIDLEESVEDIMRERGTSIVLNEYSSSDALNLLRRMNSDTEEGLETLLNQSAMILDNLIQGELIPPKFTEKEYVFNLIHELENKLEGLENFSTIFNPFLPNILDYNTVIREGRLVQQLKSKVKLLHSCILNCAKIKNVIDTASKLIGLDKSYTMLVLSYMGREDWSEYHGISRVERAIR